MDEGTERRMDRWTDDLGLGIEAIAVRTQDQRDRDQETKHLSSRFLTVRTYICRSLNIMASVYSLGRQIVDQALTANQATYQRTSKSGCLLLTHRLLTTYHHHPPLLLLLLLIILLLLVLLLPPSIANAEVSKANNKQ